MTAECVKLINNLIDDLNPMSIMVARLTCAVCFVVYREEECRRAIEYMEAKLAKLKEIITLLEILREISSNDDAMKILKKIISLSNALTPNAIVNTEKINNLRAKLEDKQRNTVGRRVVAVNALDISKNHQEETIKYIQMLKNQNEKFDNKLEIVAIGTHANKSGYTLLEIQNLQNHIRYQGIRCRIYELNPQEKKDFHPELSNIAIQDFILGKNE